MNTKDDDGLLVALENYGEEVKRKYPNPADVPIDVIYNPYSNLKKFLRKMERYEQRGG